MFWHLDPLESIMSISGVSGSHCCLKWACDMWQWKGWICLLSKMEVKTLISVIAKTTNCFGVWSANSFVGEHNSQGIFQKILLMIAVVMMAPLTKGEIRWNLWLAMSWVGGRELGLCVPDSQLCKAALQLFWGKCISAVACWNSPPVTYGISAGIWEGPALLRRLPLCPRTRRAGNLSGSPATNNATQPTSSLATNHGIGFSAHFWVTMWFACRIEDHLSRDWGSWILFL